MINMILSKIFGTKNERELKKLFPIVDEINALEPGIVSKSDDELRAKTAEFNARLTNGETLDDMLKEAFAVVREVSRRTVAMRHFDVQLIGGLALHHGKIAEMKTGEGKTLVGTLPVYLNAIGGRGVHVVTVNDYLARRDTQWMGPIYNFLGMSVGVIQHDSSFLYDPSYKSEYDKNDYLRPCTRQEAYRANITYGTNNEYGFDYLRDNMKYDLQDYVQRELNYAIVDEVDSILIDEARTPLIISGPSEDSTDKYYNINRIIPKLTINVDFTIDEKTKNAILTEDGGVRAEKLLGVDNLFDPVNIELVHHVLQGLKAHNLYKRDVDYVISDGEVLIVDEFTGRLMPGRRWSDGLHQAIEAKEGVKIESENQTLATITFQNYFRMYNKLAGMTGTADTEAEEFGKIYNLDVMVIPTNKPMTRDDMPDSIYKTEQAKFNAVTADIQGCHEKGQPVLVGTISIEKSEVLSRELKKAKIPHNVLNAKYHEKEAEIIAQAGRKGAVTIATNMAGRGTDIVLGGNPKGIAQDMLRDTKDYTPEQFKDALSRADQLCTEEKEQVLVAGGLYILGTERHEARRIDNQLRGRSGRQGDPGASKFYLSLEDDLMRIFGSDKIAGLMNRLGMEEDVPIENSMVSKAIANAQKKVEAHNFDIRKHLLEYDDVMNKQRTEIYSFRKEILSSESLKEKVTDMIKDTVDDLIAAHCPEDTYAEAWDMNALWDSAYGVFEIPRSYLKETLSEAANLNVIREKLFELAQQHYEEKEKNTSAEVLRYLEKMTLLQILDTQWKDHLLAMDHLKEGIGLRGYGQKDPLVEYKKEAFDMFAEMTYRITSEFLSRMFHIQIHGEGESAAAVAAPKKQQVFYNRSDEESVQVVRKGRKTGRNDPCTCGSGKKFKKCCGRGE
ncbi:preprotein translocase subunit SecA [Candidatus Magnetominusculus xianensis]|uniref:Protein translocase subunit SecA n=1 Tax=Candidatus Magnetominusculus xianensis TaxID=1748249 RepID=A0ABR5SIQ2_9BACT|nr:preprotein translocase subunit SecA [Candidatus Magnetominusculus xianensis]KWT84137.1 preprotein translocase subunit SecA [Candidatus Magnetominusculus xianensis]MBF0402430.1 preprotein translocase subunit SecA [Nitrospirota bacterium]